MELEINWDDLQVEIEDVDSEVIYQEKTETKSFILLIFIKYLL